MGDVAQPFAVAAFAVVAGVVEAWLRQTDIFLSLALIRRAVHSRSPKAGGKETDSKGAFSATAPLPLEGAHGVRLGDRMRPCSLQ
jgi:hypothetical protein